MLRAHATQALDPRHGSRATPPGTPRTMRLGRPAALAAALTLALGAASSGCSSSHASAAADPNRAPFHTLQLAHIVGGWRWLQRTTEDGTTRIEDEHWRFRPTGLATQLAGRYVREVEVRSDDRTPFACNQRPLYRQRAVFDVTLDATPQGFIVRETAVRTEPAPCDHGFRRLGVYAASLTGDRLELAWAGGTQHLFHLDDRSVALPEDPWPATATIEGEWRWDASSYDDAGNIQDETEWWYVTRRSDTRLDATYRRRVTVRSPTGEVIACAHAPSWTFDDAYVLDGQREEEHWRLHELAAAPGDHPCLRVTPQRSLDEATAEQIGDSLLLEWRGKRRQILYRPDRRIAEQPGVTPTPAPARPISPAHR